MFENAHQGPTSPWEGIPEGQSAFSEIPEDVILEVVETEPEFLLTKHPLDQITNNPFHTGLFLREFPELEVEVGYTYVNPLDVQQAPQDERIAEQYRKKYFGKTLVELHDKYTIIAESDGPESELALEAKEALDEAAWVTKELLLYVMNNHDTANAFNAYPFPTKLRNALEGEEGLDPSVGYQRADVDTLVELAKWNKDFMAKKCEEQRPMLEQIKAEFKDRITVAIQEQGFPGDLETVLAKLDRVAVMVIDPLALIDEQSGEFKANREIAIVVAAVEPDYSKTKEDLYHELMHAISGREVHIAKVPDFEWDVDSYAQLEAHGANNGVVVNSRIGLMLQAQTQDNQEYMLYTWANEAVTEQLTQILLMPADAVLFVPPHNPNNIPASEIAAKNPLRPDISAKGTYLGFKDMNEAVLTLSGTDFYDVLCAYLEDGHPGDAPAKQQIWFDGISRLGGGILTSIEAIQDQMRTPRMIERLRDLIQLKKERPELVL